MGTKHPESCEEMTECILGNGVAGGDFTEERKALSCYGGAGVTDRVQFRVLCLIQSCLTARQTGISRRRTLRSGVHLGTEGGCSPARSRPVTVTPVTVPVCQEGRSFCLCAAFKHLGASVLFQCDL